MDNRALAALALVQAKTDNEEEDFDWSVGNENMDNNLRHSQKIYEAKLRASGHVVRLIEKFARSKV